MKVNHRSFFDSISGWFHKACMRSTTVLMIDDGPLNLTGVANTIRSESITESITAPMSSSIAQAPSLQTLHPLQCAMSFEMRSTNS